MDQICTIDLSLIANYSIPEPIRTANGENSTTLTWTSLYAYARCTLTSTTLTISQQASERAISVLSKVPYVDSLAAESVAILDAALLMLLRNPHRYNPFNAALRPLWSTPNFHNTPVSGIVKMLNVLSNTHMRRIYTTLHFENLIQFCRPDQITTTTSTTTTTTTNTFVMTELHQTFKTFQNMLSQYFSGVEISRSVRIQCYELMLFVWTFYRMCGVGRTYLGRPIRLLFSQQRSRDSGVVLSAERSIGRAMYQATVRAQRVLSAMYILLRAIRAESDTYDRLRRETTLKLVLRTLFNGVFPQTRSVRLFDDIVIVMTTQSRVGVRSIRPDVIVQELERMEAPGFSAKKDECLSGDRAMLVCDQQHAAELPRMCARNMPVPPDTVAYVCNSRVSEPRHFVLNNLLEPACADHYRTHCDRRWHLTRLSPHWFNLRTAVADAISEMGPHMLNN
jgi:hypothetical protein